MSEETFVFNVKERVEALEGTVEPKFPLCVEVRVTHAKTFKTKEEFEKYLKEDLVSMGYIEEEEDGGLTWSNTDVECWKENYEGVPFPPKTVQDYVAYASVDIQSDRYTLDEMDFEECSTDTMTFTIREVKEEDL